MKDEERSWQLLCAFGALPEELLADGAAPPKQGRRRLWVGGAAAALLAVALWAGLTAGPFCTPSSVATLSLPEEATQDDGISTENEGAPVENSIGTGEKNSSDFAANPAAPEADAMQELTLGQARALPRLGTCLPTAPPAGFVPESLCCDAAAGSLFALWSSGARELCWKVQPLTAADLQRVVTAEERERYDLRRYEGQDLAQTVPEELWQTLENPVFAPEELSAGLLAARREQGDEGLESYRFSLRCGSLLVEIASKGVDAGWLLEQAAQLCKTQAK